MIKTEYYGITVKQFKYINKKDDSDEYGILDKINYKNLHNYFIVRNTYYNIYYVFNSIGSFLNWFNYKSQNCKRYKDNEIFNEIYHLEEIILGTNYQKLYIDIDLKGIFNKNDKNYVYKNMKKFKKELIKYLNRIYLPRYKITDENILIFNSNGYIENDKYKYSFHIICDNYIFTNSLEQREFISDFINELKENNKIDKNIINAIDDKIYKSIQNFRLLFSKKLDSSRFKQIDKKLTDKRKIKLIENERTLLDEKYPNEETQLIINLLYHSLINVNEINIIFTKKALNKSYKYKIPNYPLYVLDSNYTSLYDNIKIEEPNLLDFINDIDYEDNEEYKTNLFINKIFHKYPINNEIVKNYLITGEIKEDIKRHLKKHITGLKCEEFNINNLIDEHRELMENFEFREERNGILIFNRVSASYCPLCERIHDNDNIYIIKYENSYFYHCYRNNNNQSLRLKFKNEKKDNYKNFNNYSIDLIDDNNNYNHNNHNNNNKFKYISYNVYKKKKKNIFIQSQTGSGKTEALIKYINKFNNKYNTILFITFRKSFTSDLIKRLNNNLKNIKFDDYRNFKKENIIKSNYLICQLESIHKLDHRYDLIIIDEIESILNQFHSINDMSFFNIIADTFKILLRNSKKNIFMDALLSKDCVNLINLICKTTNEDNFIYSHPYKKDKGILLFNEEDKFIKLINDYKLYNDLNEKDKKRYLKNNNDLKDFKKSNKIYVYLTNSIKRSEFIYELLINLKIYPKSRILLLNSKTENKEEIFKNIDNYISTHHIKFIISTTSLSAGVDIKHQIYQLFVYYHDFHGMELIQQINRFRNIENKIINCYLIHANIKNKLICNKKQLTEYINMINFNIIDEDNENNEDNENKINYNINKMNSDELTQFLNEMIKEDKNINIENMKFLFKKKINENGKIIKTIKKFNINDEIYLYSYFKNNKYRLNYKNIIKQLAQSDGFKYKEDYINEDELNKIKESNKKTNKEYKKFKIIKDKEFYKKLEKIEYNNNEIVEIDKKKSKRLELTEEEYFKYKKYKILDKINLDVKNLNFSDLEYINSEFLKKYNNSNDFELINKSMNIKRLNYWLNQYKDYHNYLINLINNDEDDNNLKSFNKRNYNSPELVYFKYINKGNYQLYNLFMVYKIYNLFHINNITKFEINYIDFIKVLHSNEYKLFIDEMKKYNVDKYYGLEFIKENETTKTKINNIIKKFIETKEIEKEELENLKCYLKPYMKMFNNILSKCGIRIITKHKGKNKLIVDNVYHIANNKYVYDKDKNLFLPFYLKKGKKIILYDDEKEYKYLKLKNEL